MKKLEEGKTKIIYEDGEDVVRENKDDITKNDDRSQTQKMEGKAVLSTVIACIVFEILRAARVPVAYLKRVGERSFKAKKCRMIRLEVIVRRYAVGSVVSRNPKLKRKGIPFRFDDLLVEFFLKTTDGVVKDKEGKIIGYLPDDPEKEKPIDDPLIADPKSLKWMLRHPKQPAEKGDSGLGIISSEAILPKGVSIEGMNLIAVMAFLVLEKFFSLIGLRLIDFKIEFGITADGELVIADVVDNDSWRLRTLDWEELSKELFRQNESMEKIKESYEYVAKKLIEAYNYKWP
jgi:phosphoribosylaminoimidazole carboxylase/phosphoribosylaminoimidazole-succinocarboxamide synthase